MPERTLIKVALRAMILIYITTWSNTSMITTILLCNSWAAILLWGKHCIVFITEFMMECFFEVIDDITNAIGFNVCDVVFVREILGNRLSQVIFPVSLKLHFKKLGGNLVRCSSRVTGPYLKKYFNFFCSG